jgi:hypothetical protein
MSDTDGSMSTHVLASHVSQRLKPGGVNGLNRSLLLAQLAGQLEQFHKLQLCWEEQWTTAKHSVSKANEELQCRDIEIERIRAATKERIQAHQQKMAEICREMCAGVDEHRLKQHKDDTSLVRSQQRVAEQRSMVASLEDQEQGLERSREKTMQKFDEVSRAFHAARNGLCNLDVPDSQVSCAFHAARNGLSNLDAPNSQEAEQQLKDSARNALVQAFANGSLEQGVTSFLDAESRAADAQKAAFPGSSMTSSKAELRGAQTQARAMAEEAQKDDADLINLKSQLSRLKAEMTQETSRAVKLESILRRIAKGPSASVRRGGGFALDSTAKREATALLQEAAVLADAKASAHRTIVSVRQAAS